MKIGVELERMTGLRKKFRTIQGIARPASTFAMDWAEDVRDAAQRHVPTWSRELHDSIEIRLGPGKLPRFAEVYSEDPKARWLEYGTGMLSLDPESIGNRYFPPPKNVKEWAEDHGMAAWSVANAIYEKGGTEPHLFFTRAMNEVNSTLGPRIERFGRMIELEFSEDY